MHRRRREQPGRHGEISSRTPAPQAPGEERRTPRRRGRSRARVPRSNGSSRLAAFSSNGGASRPRPAAKATLGPHQVDPGALAARRAARRSAVARSARAASKAPAWRLASAAASARSARRAGSTVSATARCRNAAAAATPPRACARPAERSSSAATSSSGPGVARARCQARRSGSVSASVASARARCTRLAVVGGGRAVDGGPDEWVRELDAPLRPRAVRRPRPGRLRPCRCRASRRPGGAARGRRAAPRPRRGRAAGCRPGARGGAGRSSVRSCRPPGGCREVRTRRRARRRSRCAAARAARADCRGSRRRSGRRRPRRAGRARWSSSSARASLSPSPPTGNSGSPARTSSPMPVRAAHTSATRSARRRRATKPRICADAWSSHCASSTTQSERLLLGDLGEQRQRGQPDQEPVGCGPALRPNTVASASRCGTGSRSRSIEHRRAELMQPAVGELHLGLDADRPRDVPAGDAVGQVAQQGALADARLAPQDDDAAPTGETCRPRAGRAHRTR